METSTVIQGVSMLMPVALFVARGCLARIRDPAKIQKHVLVLPSKGGKTFLTQRLSKQKTYMIIDLDEAIAKSCSPEELTRYTSEMRSGGFLKSQMYYTECANKVLTYIRTQLKKNRGLKVLFLTSCYAFASQFKPDSIAIACPDREFFDEILEEHAGMKEELRQAREDFLEAVPKPAVQSYNSYAELEKMVRARLKIVHTL